MKPFLKWAGGKSQIIQDIRANLPADVVAGNILSYVEPFVGGGAMFFHLFPQFGFERALLLDINPDLIVAYTVVQKDVDSLIDCLHDYTQHYLELDDENRSTHFYEIREHFNDHRFNVAVENYDSRWIVRAAQLIFLNKTCFNGLYRVNRKGEFNVPFGRYKNPAIFDADNLRNAATLLGRADIKCADFSAVKEWVKGQAFVYYDPPYKPISKTSNFTAYSKESFSDEDQLRLIKLFAELDRRGGISQLMSNSDPEQVAGENTFFSDHLKRFAMVRVNASRNINAQGTGRGKIKEILVRNYTVV